MDTFYRSTIVATILPSTSVFTYTRTTYDYELPIQLAFDICSPLKLGIFGRDHVHQDPHTGFNSVSDSSQTSLERTRPTPGRVPHRLTIWPLLVSRMHELPRRYLGSFQTPFSSVFPLPRSIKTSERKQAFFRSSQHLYMSGDAPTGASVYKSCTKDWPPGLPVCSLTTSPNYPIVSPSVSSFYHRILASHIYLSTHMCRMST